jgi:hypothetical protein
MVAGPFDYHEIRTYIYGFSHWLLKYSIMEATLQEVQLPLGQLSYCKETQVT